MNMYYVESVDTNCKNYVYKDNITIANLKELEHSYEVIKMLCNYIDYYIMVIDNCREFLEDCTHNGIGNNKNFIRSNRLFLNFLNMFYVWREYLLKHKINNSMLNVLKHNEDKGHIGLIKYLRHYSIHNNTPITSIKYDSLRNKSCFIIRLDKIMTSKQLDGMYADAKKIIGNNMELDALLLIKQFIVEFKLLNNNLSEVIEPTYINSYNNIVQYVPRISPDCYNAVLVEEDSNFRINLGRLLEILENKETILNNY